MFAIRYFHVIYLYILFNPSSVVLLLTFTWELLYTRRHCTPRVDNFDFRGLVLQLCHQTRVETVVNNAVLPFITRNAVHLCARLASKPAFLAPWATFFVNCLRAIRVGNALSSTIRGANWFVVKGATKFFLVSWLVLIW